MRPSSPTSRAPSRSASVAGGAQSRRCEADEVIREILSHHRQRPDTSQAAKLAGLTLIDYDLIDKPLAALNNYLFTAAEPEFMDKPANVVVFEFSGGS